MVEVGGGGGGGGGGEGEPLYGDEPPFQNSTYTLQRIIVTFLEHNPFHYRY